MMSNRQDAKVAKRIQEEWFTNSSFHWRTELLFDYLAV